MSLSKILEEMKKIKPFIEENLEGGAYETLSARRGRKNQSIETMKRLRREYTNTLRTGAAYIVVTGDRRDGFVSVATESFKCFSADPEEFFKDLVGRIPSALYLGREDMNAIFGILARHLEDKAMELDIVGYPQLIFKQSDRRRITSTEEFTSMIRDVIVDRIGGELVGIQAATSLADQAISSEHSSKFTPILLSTGDEKFALKMAESLERISNRVYTVVVGKASKGLKSAEGAVIVREPTPENVENALKSISNQLKK